MVHVDGDIKERYGDGSLELIVSDTDKKFWWAYHVSRWGAKSLEEQVRLRAAAIRISDYWWAKGYEEVSG